ncbi:hypothetical protein B0T13DRAFT_178211 [Neurospora crassa]|nr:hypothetical protein B0T13DRAFT_178211 [Neurospora crassa]
MSFQADQHLVPFQADKETLSFLLCSQRSNARYVFYTILPILHIMNLLYNGRTILSCGITQHLYAIYLLPYLLGFVWLPA